MGTIFSQDLEVFWKNGQNSFDKALRAFLATAPTGTSNKALTPENLTDATAYALGVDTTENTGGKHIRPMLCLLAAQRLGGAVELAMPFALAIEIMHNFTLVHDDIEDEDEMRRGRPAVWKRHGQSHGINIGDYMQNLVWRALLDRSVPLAPATRVRLCALMADTVDLTIRGQALDMNARGRQIDRTQYMEIVTLKTGYCLGAPLLAGAIVANADEAVLNGLRQFGLALGPLFQIRDDVIDMTANKGREAIGSDICEGKRSFLVAVAFERASEPEARLLMAILDKPRHETTTEDILRCRDLFQKVGAFDEAHYVCARLAKDVHTVIATLPPSLAKALDEIVKYLVEREK